MTSIVIERDLAVPMRDGVRLFANLFRPAADGPYDSSLAVPLNHRGVSGDNGVV
jgi:predicted acyl esterase